MVTFKKGKIKIRTRDGMEEADAWIASNGLAIQGSGSGRRGSYTITHTGSGLGFSSWVHFNDLADAKRFVSEVEGAGNFHDKDFRPKTDEIKKIRQAYLTVRPDMKSRQEKEDEENARRKADAEKDKAARQGRKDYGNYPYKGGKDPRKLHLNDYNIDAQNRRGDVIAKATAEGSRARDRAKSRIYHDKSTWLKFSTYNRTRGKFLKNRRYT